ncbi:MAG: hypothetical protein ACRDNE_15985 [Gaiellaceae bacterium]
MRLVRRLFKTLVVVVAAAAVLGGAAALGSTLFEPPPKDAAEFAERVAAGSDRSRDKRTPGEARYVRKLNALCTRMNRDFDALPRPEGLEEFAAFLESWQRLVRGFDADFRALPAPPRYRADASRIAELDRAVLRVGAAAERAARRGHRHAFGVSTAEGGRLDRSFDRVMRRIGATVCTEN